MRVINAVQLWDNKRLREVRASRHIKGALLLGVIVGTVLSLALLSTESVSTKTAALHGPAVAGISTDEAQMVDKLLPLGNSFANLPLQLKTQPPPPPPPDCAVEACLALSFDDGPDPVNTPKIMDILDKQHVPATFFLIGYRVAPNAAVVQRMHQDGFEIGNHSWNHPDFTKLTAAQMTDQVNQTQQAITALGVPAPTLFRPPYGAVNDTLRNTIHMSIIRWDVDPKDWAKNDPAAVIATVEAQAKPGGIVLMHSTRAATAAALDTILANLKSRFHLVTVTQLLQLAPGTQGEYIGR